MRQSGYLLACGAVVGLLGVFLLGPTRAAENTLTAEEQAQGWRLLFDGKSLEGWVVPGRKEGWTVEDGTIVCQAQGGGDLRTAKQYDDFDLSLDFRLTPGANSGVFIRVGDPNDPVQTGIEVQLYDSFGKQPSRWECGAIYDCLAPSQIACRPAGEWNTLQVTCRAKRITVRLNHEQIIEMDLNRWTTAHKNPDGSDNKFRTPYREMPRQGFISLQDHGHRIWFRNLKIRQLAQR